MNFSDEIILALYKETYRQSYNPKSKEKLKGTIKKEHQNVMYMMYLVQKIINMDMYGFVWNFNGPYSRFLHSELKEIDKKANEVQKFYATYFKERYNKQLFKYFDGYEIQLLEKFFLLISPFSQKSANGMQVIAAIHFLAITVYSASDYKFIFNKYNELCSTEKDKKLLLKAWDCLDNLDLLYETQSRKLERNL